MFFPTNSYAENFLVTFSTSGHDRKCFRFLKNIIKVYIWHVFWLILAWQIWWWCFQLPVIIGSTSDFLKNIKTRNLDMFSEQFEYAEFSEDILNFRLWLPALPVCRKHCENVISALFLNKTSPLNTMKIFSASGYDGKYFWFLKNLQKLYYICLITFFIVCHDSSKEL